MKNITLHQTILAGKQKRGPHFFFPMFFRDYIQSEQQDYNAYYFVKTNDPEAIQKEFLKLGLESDRVIFLPMRNHRFKTWHEKRDLKKALKMHDIDAFHLLTYANPSEDMPLLEMVQEMSIPMLFTVTYNGVPTAFQPNAAPRFEKDRKKYGPLFEKIRFQGLLSWYDDWPDFVNENPMFPQKPMVYVINSRYCDSSRFKPVVNKRKLVLFASALVPYKNPMMFVEAVALLSRWGSLRDGWKFMLCGQGSEIPKIKEAMQYDDLVEWMAIAPPTEYIEHVVNSSRLYVSCQDIDNFPSLAMNEAMASGNAIIARPVGRTDLFVKDGVNGYIAEEDSAHGIAKAMEKYLLKHEKEQEKMQDASVQLTKEVHTAEAFIRQVNEFWDQSLNQ